MKDLTNVTVAILAGGQGTRLASVLPGQQKVVAKVKGHPFIEYILNKLGKKGIKKVVMCTGYLGDQVEETFGNNYQGISLVYSREKSPLGTAGAIAIALPLLKSEIIMVTNGDSFYDYDLHKFYKFHYQKKAEGSILLTETDCTGRYGIVKVDYNDKITSFAEKEENSGKSFINAGIYLFKRSVLLEIPKGRMVSFEREMFPNWIGRGFYGFKSQGRFTDIGTPQSYKEAEEFFSKYSI